VEFSQMEIDFRNKKLRNRQEIGVFLCPCGTLL